MIRKRKYVGNYKEEKEMKKILASALIACMSLSLLAGCGGSDNTNADAGNNAAVNTEAAGTTTEAVAATDVALKVWCPQNQIDTGLMAEQTAAFQALHPEWNITWTIEAVGEDNAKTEIMKDVEMAADVFFYANDQVVELVNAGAIARLGGAVEAMVNETIASNVADTVKVDGALYGIPFTHNTFFMYYDKTIMTEEDVKTIEGIVNKETADGVYNFYFESAGGWKLGAWYYGAGCSVYGPNGDDLAAGFDWNNETGVAVTNYLIDLIANPKVGYDGEITPSELVDEHRLGVWFSGSWDYQLYKDKLGDNLGLAVIPTFNLNGTDHQLLSFYGSKCIGVNARSKYPAAANAFAAFLGSEAQQLVRFEKSGQAPTNLVAGENEAVLADEVSKVLVAESNTASVAQPTAAIFSNRYWANAGVIPTEIKNGNITHDNVQEQMDKVAETMNLPE